MCSLRLSIHLRIVRALFFVHLPCFSPHFQMSIVANTWFLCGAVNQTGRCGVASKRASFVVTSCRDLQHAAVNQIKCLFLNESGELQEGMFSLKKHCPPTVCAVLEGWWKAVICVCALDFISWTIPGRRLLIFLDLWKSDAFISQVMIKGFKAGGCWKQRSSYDVWNRRSHEDTTTTSVEAALHTCRCVNGGILQTFCKLRLMLDYWESLLRRSKTVDATGSTV